MPLECAGKVSGRFQELPQTCRYYALVFPLSAHTLSENLPDFFLNIRVVLNIIILNVMDKEIIE